MSDKESSPKSFLTHRPKATAPAPETLRPAPKVMEAEAVPRREIHQAALSGKMATISSLRESAGPSASSRKNAALGKATSTLPAAMARVHRQHQEEEIRERLREPASEKKALIRRPHESADLRVEDPHPGLAASVFWFVFAFGKFAKSALLVQPLSVTLLFWMLCGMGSIQFLMPWIVPAPGPGLFYDSRFAVQVLGGGILAGLLACGAVSQLLHLLLKRKWGGISRWFGLKLVVDAFLPLALMQLIVLGTGTFLIGEAYWRGTLPAGYGIFAGILLPFCWIWGGYRMAQGVTGLFQPAFPVRLGLKIGMLFLFAFPLLIARSGLFERLGAARDADWEQLRLDAMASADPLPRERFDRMLDQLPFRDTARKRDLYLYRMQAAYRQDRLEDARADALRLDRMAVPDSADDDLAKGLNFLFRNRLDLAIPRFESAIAKDPACTPAHQWLALGQVASDIGRSEAHAKILMQADPNVFHLQLLVRILFAQEKYQDIWDAMLTVDAAPGTWDPLTLDQGAVAAEKLGNPRRAQFLRALARSKGLDYAGE